MSDAELPEAPGQGEPEKKGLLSRGVGAVKQAQAQRAGRQASAGGQGAGRSTEGRRGGPQSQASAVS
jgi:hypothetical protein